jgi:hypothetical protein
VTAAEKAYAFDGTDCKPKPARLVRALPFPHDHIAPVCCELLLLQCCLIGPVPGVHGKRAILVTAKAANSGLIVVLLTHDDDAPPPCTGLDSATNRPPNKYRPRSSDSLADIYSPYILQEESAAASAAADMAKLQAKAKATGKATGTGPKMQSDAGEAIHCIHHTLYASHCILPYTAPWAPLVTCHTTVRTVRCICMCSSACVAVRVPRDCACVWLWLMYDAEMAALLAKVGTSAL